MLEVNDFNAIRLSLASPAQIRSWSYGEVTKPETINYRTLKPEKDGLFCERIFGPQKDFECYCGKYKRVRYKGIVCDKCGVEVARSKVRRERMAHINLAAPVAHIWFSKGVPSRLGLLLDVPPRALERVLYFAQHVITEVNDEARQHALELLHNEIDEEASKREGENSMRVEVREEALEQEITEIQRRKDEELATADEEMATAVDETVAEAAELGKDLEGRKNEKLRGKLVFRKETIAARSEVIKAGTLKTLRDVARQLVGAIEENTANKKADVQMAAEAAIQKKRDDAFKELEPLREQIAEVRNAVSDEYSELVKRLEKLRDPLEADALTILAEAEHSELEERFGLVFKSGMGAEAILAILERLDLDGLRVKLHEEIATTKSAQRLKKAQKRLRVIESLRRSGNRPEWMVISDLPVLPPDLRPMVQLDGGRFATSDLNDLYRRVINRNNRLKRLLNLGAPEIIIRNEKRMLQEAVDSLIDNGRRGRAVSGSGNHKLKSLSDLLKGKHGRFRQNLLGKRVDYSGRSVIVVGPDLSLGQCGLPKKMALELFKPFIMHSLVRKGLAHNIKSAKRIVERARSEVWDVLDEVIQDRPVLLNRAPTLWRLGIQAFEPVLVEGSALQLHPLVCFAYNADFDGDQMAVHVPLSYEAVAEARQVMLSTKNLLSPSDGEPIIAPTLDMVLGCFYLTFEPLSTADDVENSRAYNFNAIKMSYDLGHMKIHDRVRFQDNGRSFNTTVGRVLFNEIVPDEIGFLDELMDKKGLRELVARIHEEVGPEATVEFVDKIKDIGFRYATQSGISIAASDLDVSIGKTELMAAADEKVDELADQFQAGLVTENERYRGAIDVWAETTNRIQEAIQTNLPPQSPLAMMSNSGAKGNITQVRQMAGLRGLMTDPSGRIIDLPIRSSFRDGLSVLEYFISTHGARKGLADTALRTADSGYLTRRMIDVAQDLVIRMDDCTEEGGPIPGVWLREHAEAGILATLDERLTGRWTGAAIADPESGEVLVEANEEITVEMAVRIAESTIGQVYVRSPVACQARRGVCQKCYGRSLATGELVAMGVAVGIIAAQSIGEPGTQLTMQTFHTGGVAGGQDITSGLPRVEEIFEARVPKGQAVMSEIDGIVELSRDGDQRLISVSHTEVYDQLFELPDEMEPTVEDGEVVEADQMLAAAPDPKPEPGEKKKNRKKQLPVVRLETPVEGTVQFVRDGRKKRPTHFKVITEDTDLREYPIAAASRVRVESGEFVHAGDQLTEGFLNPQDVLAIRGAGEVAKYLVEGVQQVYRSQGVNINDRHIEVIVRQMLRKVTVEEVGDTEMLSSEIVDRWAFEDANARAISEGGELATAVPVLLGVTKASLNTDSFLSAASFQETTRVLTDAAISGRTDYLRGLKENVIIGKLIPARAEITVERPTPIAEIPIPESLLLPFLFDFEREDRMAEEAALEAAGGPTAPELATSFVADPD
ncbi:MAG TPA: DNA-directed RNA polymerase subunit beta' [Dehalococcoidia bacterium]|nr:DNA-directed RNA polymerase subunit beta' [Dehalococcoidia bacterium]